MPEARPLSATARLLLAALGAGYAPGMPGTAGSIVTAAAVVLLDRAGLGLPGAIALVVLGSAVTLVWGGRALRPDGRGDPGWVVSDEVAGQAIASGVAVAVHGGLVAAAAALVLFRVLDIMKPGPIARLERLPGGVGVLADDLAAGCVAGAVVLGLSWAGLFAR